MCGITGYVNLRDGEPPSEGVLRLMLAQIRHRGPDEFGIYLDEHAGLGNARLSIVDLAGGQQPMDAGDGRYWIVYNGEVFNHAELREELLRQGRRAETHCDTEVVLECFAREGPACLDRFNGQFAIAIWDATNRELFLARDRVGVRPLFFARREGVFLFGSEIKAMAAHPSLALGIDPVALDQVFTGWSCLPPRTAFDDVHELPPGHFMIVSAEKGVRVQCWWRPDFVQNDLFPVGSTEGTRPSNTPIDPASLVELRRVLSDATRLRLLADVPVGAYLSGGLDSSLIAALARGFVGGKLDTFSIAFTDAAYDERRYQQRMAGHLGTSHQVVEATHEDIGDVFPDVVWHCETPLLRTAPVPMFLLSALVRKSGYKVVLTGEGADELFAGYDIFKEAKIRAFWARQPGSVRRPTLFQRIYPDLQNLARLGPRYLASFFGERLTDTTAPDYTHLIRWRNTRRTQRFFSADLNARIKASAISFSGAVPWPERFAELDLLSRAQYTEMVTFLSPYLLSSQGDRVGMAHSVEGRFPFLDVRVMEFAMRLPVGLRMPALRDKFLLRQLGGELLPEEVASRPKKPYRAPIHRSFFHRRTPAYVSELLSERVLAESGLFNAAAVAKLVAKITDDQPVGETDDMALAGILSTQLLHRFCAHGFRVAAPLSDRDSVKVCDRRKCRSR